MMMRSPPAFLPLDLADIGAAEGGAKPCRPDRGGWPPALPEVARQAASPVSPAYTTKSDEVRLKLTPCRST